MLRLHTFGGLSLDSDDADLSGAALQKRRLALLAMLAVAGRRGLTRDKVLGLLWPDVDESRGRPSLSQALYALRRDTGEDDLVTGSELLALNGDVVTSDVGEFLLAIETGALERAVELHAGAFLDGVFLADAPEFERWLDAQRVRLTRMVEGALEQLATDADQRRDYPASIAWWRRLTALDPLRTRAVAGLMSALAAGGERTVALRHAEEYGRLVRDELDAEPSAVVTQLADTLRGNAGERLFAERYAIARELGRGGMAVVFLARDRKHDRLVAIKMLHPELSAAVGRERLEREILITAKLQHPHILPLHDSGEWERTLYYVMPFVDGESLRARLIRDSQLAVTDALVIAREVAEALDHAHRRGVVHRDIKPENILLAEHHAVVADFGIARLVSTAIDSSLTQVGMALGTPAYMSPEQVTGGEDVGPPSDVFSLGCVLFEMLAGRPPWIGVNAQAVIARRFTEPPPSLRSMRADVPRWLETLVQRMLSLDPGDRPATASEVAALLSGGASDTPSNLPASTDELIGRERELASARVLLERPDVRLLTLTGAGGSGKTRLAVQLATDLESSLDRVYFVDLSSVREPAGVLPAIASAIGVHGQGENTLMEPVSAALASQRVLIVLDNFEQVVGAAPSVSLLISRCPTVTILVSSRIRLGLRAEHEFFIAPLAIPDDPESASIAELRASPAVQLFERRAREADAALVLDDDAVRAVAGICVRLDGLPLAIELAAARCRLMSPHNILARLGKGFMLLTGGGRDMPERHRTIRQTIVWSHGLLAANEQRVFARIAVFAGGCTLEAIEAVCTSDRDDLDVLGGVEALVDASLLMKEAHGGIGNEPRFRMLELVRDFALELHAQDSDAAVLAVRHGEWYLRLATTLAPTLTGEAQFTSLAILAVEHHNMRAALDGYLAREDSEGALRLGAALWRFWLVRGHLAEGRAWMRRISALAPVPSLDSVRADFLTGAAHLAQNNGAVGEATSYFESVLDLRRRLGDTQGEVRALSDLGWMAWRRCEYDSARQLSGDSFAIAERIGDNRGMALALNNLGVTALFEADLPKAREYLDRSRTIRSDIADRRGAAFAGTFLALTECRAGQFSRARELLAASMSTYQSIGDQRLYHFALNVLCEVSLREGNAAEAARRLDAESIPMLQRLGDRWAMAQALALRGWAARELGDFDSADSFGRTSLDLRRAEGDVYGETESLALLESIRARSVSVGGVEVGG